MKYRIEKIKEDQTLTSQYYMTTLQEAKLPKVLPLDGLDAQDELNEWCNEPIEDLILV